MLKAISTFVLLTLAGAVLANPNWDPTKLPNFADPNDVTAYQAALYCLDHEGKILDAGVLRCAANESDVKIPLQLSINGKVYWTPQGDQRYANAWKSFKTVKPNDGKRLVGDPSKPLAFDNTNCEKGLCIHLANGQKEYACYEKRTAYRWRKALGVLRSYAIKYEDYNPRR